MLDLEIQITEHYNELLEYLRFNCLKMIIIYLKHQDQMDLIHGVLRPNRFWRSIKKETQIVQNNAMKILENTCSFLIPFIKHGLKAERKDICDRV